MEELSRIQSQQVERFKLKKRPNSVRSQDSHHYHLHGTELDLGLETASATQHEHSSSEGLKVSQLTKELEISQQLQFNLESENLKLKCKLKKVEQELRRNPEVTAGVAENKATEMIMDLSKRNRELNAAVSAEKYRVQELTKKLKLYEDHNAAITPKDYEDQPGRDHEVKKLKQQLDQCNMKLMESRNENQITKQELKLAQKIIANEVGEVDSNLLISGASNWRGRAQQIVMLQNKLKEVKRQLAKERRGNTDGKVRTNSWAHTLECTDTNQKATLAKMERERKLKLRDTQIELESLRKELLNAQQQCNALKARNKTLTSDLKHARSKLDTPSHRVETTLQLSSEREQEKAQLEKQNQILEQRLLECLHKLQTDHHRENILPKGTKLRDSDVCEKTTVVPMQQNGLSEMKLDALLRVTMMEKDKLFKLSQSLQQRLDASTDQLIKLNTNLRIQKQHAKKLEISSHSNPIPSANRTGEAEGRLVLLTNENMVLKETLQLTRHEKYEDMTLLSAMVQDAKVIFTDSIKSIMSNNTK